MSLNNTKPMFDPATRYRIEVRGRVDAEWLKSFDSSAEIIVEESGQIENITILDVYADQAGIVGLVRRLHGLGVTIQQFRVIPPKEK